MLTIKDNTPIDTLKQERLYIFPTINNQILLTTEQADDVGILKSDTPIECFVYDRPLIIQNPDNDKQIIIADPNREHAEVCQIDYGFIRTIEYVNLYYRRDIYDLLGAQL